MPTHGNAAIQAIVQIGLDDWLAFHDPVCVLSSDTTATIRSLIGDVEAMTRDQQLHAVGFVTYEAGAAFGLEVSGTPSGLPLAWFALFEGAHVAPCRRPAAAVGYDIGPLTPSLDRSAFESAFLKVRDYIAAGETYQANLTFALNGSFRGEPQALFADLVEAQRGRYSAFIDLGDHAICSASPELFFEIRGLEIRTCPMKGTAPRGLTLEHDRRQRQELETSPKQRAENVMIVDMMRNDLGRIAEVGSVAVPELFTVERYPTLWQMTSRVTARSMAPLADIFAALHPSASVTGAPKVRTMQILNEIETAPRGVYTGAIGYVPPDGNATFSVGIRTAVVDKTKERICFGVGSGIVWDSNASDEYDECLLKARVLGARPRRFELLETLRWTPEWGYSLLERHLERLTRSAEYFDFPCDAAAARELLHAVAAHGAAAQRVRLLLAADGSVRVETQPLVTREGPLRTVIAARPVDSTDLRLYHKTTSRELYDEARRLAPQADDVILWNERGEVTESTVANVVIDVDGRRVTPPVDCGLLAGTFRAELLARGEVEEQVVTLDDLGRAAKFWLVNSVHEWRLAVVDPAP